jgi:hypothetical protein
VTAAQKKLRAALLGVPGEKTDMPPHRPGFSVVEITFDAGEDGEGTLFEIRDGDDECVGTFESDAVAEALAEICNEATS